MYEADCALFGLQNMRRQKTIFQFFTKLNASIFKEQITEMNMVRKFWLQKSQVHSAPYIVIKQLSCFSLKALLIKLLISPVSKGGNKVEGL